MEVAKEYLWMIVRWTRGAVATRAATRHKLNRARGHVHSGLFEHLPMNDL